MNEVKVYCLDNSELMEEESKSKGYRTDIYVNIDNKYFHLNIYDIVRLQQDFESELEDYGYFSIEENIVIVEDVVKDKIISTLKKLNGDFFFTKLKEINLDSEFVTSLKPL